MSQFKFAQPVFEEVLVEDNLKDGYWLDAVDIDGDGRLDLIATGLAVGEVVWYQNRSPKWVKHSIGSFPKPVAIDCRIECSAVLNPRSANATRQLQ